MERARGNLFLEIVQRRERTVPECLIALFWLEMIDSGNLDHKGLNRMFGVHENRQRGIINVNLLSVI